MGVRVEELQVVTRLDQITTVWETLDDPSKFVIRYAPAIRCYLTALMQNADQAEEVIQNFLLRVVQKGFKGVAPGRGRFRDYLRTAVRHTALTELRRNVAQRRHRASTPPDKETPIDSKDSAEREWLMEWRQCLLSRTWRALERHDARQRRAWPHVVLRLATQFPSEKSAELAARASAIAGAPISAEAFRQQLCRARRVFARILVAEVAETLQRPTPQDVEDELSELGLMSYVRDFLPQDWRDRGVLPSSDEEKA